MTGLRGRWRLIGASILALSILAAGGASARTPAPSDPNVTPYAPAWFTSFRTGPSFQAGLTYRPDATLSISGSLFVSDGFESDFTLFSAPRPTGAVAHDERSTSPGQVQASISVRRAV